MRKVVFGGANSLDNYLARPDGAVDWLLWDKEVGAVIAESWRRFDTLLMGRKTYEVSLQHGGGGSAGGVKTYVFSRTLRAVSGAELVKTDAVGFVRRLKEQEGRDICVMGGGDFAMTLFEAGLIDEIGFNIHPVLLGSGAPLFFPMERQIDLELLECKVFKTGCVLVSYRVRH